jgi:hypothetical protein
LSAPGPATHIEPLVHSVRLFVQQTSPGVPHFVHFAAAPKPPVHSVFGALQVS